MLDLRELKDRLLKSKLVNDSFWALAGNIIGRGLSLAAGIIVARFLGKDIYGEYEIIRTTLISMAMFSTFGLGYTATKYIAEYKNNKPEYIKLILQYSQNITLIVSGIMAIGLFSGAAYLAEKVLGATHLTTPIRLIAIWVVFNAVTTTQIGILAGFGEFKGIARVNAIVGIITFITSAVFTYYWQFNGALVALLITQILNWYLNNRLVKQNCQAPGTGVIKDKILLKEIFIFSLPVALQEALYSSTTWLTSFLLVKLSFYAELGLYSAAMRWNAVILFIPGILRNVILSHLSNSVDNQLRHDRILKLTLRFNFILTSILFLSVYIFSGFIVGLYGPNFQGLKDVINIAVFISIFSSLSNVYAQAYLSKGRSWLMFILRFIRDIGIFVISLIFLIRNNGIEGAYTLVVSTLIMHIIFLVIMFAFYKLSVQKI